jgi:uncharacterized protein YkwD
MQKQSSRAAATAGAVALLAVLLASAGTASSQRPALRVDDSTRLVERVNAVRVAHGLVALRPSAALDQAALAHSREMLEHGAFAHESPDGTSFSQRVRQYYPVSGFASWRVAENLLLSSTTLRPERAVALWLASPPHRQTLLDPRLSEVGIAAVFTTAAPGDFRGRQAWVVTMDAGARRRA